MRKKYKYEEPNTLFVGIAAHKPIADIRIPYHHVICAGAERNAAAFEGMGVILDDMRGGDSISAKNPIYNELTVQYWMWKQNMGARYIGLVHYRRYWNFRSNSAARYPRVSEPFLSSKISQKYGWNEDVLSTLFSDENVLQTADIYWAKVEADVKPGIFSIYENNRRIGNNKAIDLLIESIKAVSPGLLGSTHEYFNQKSKHMFNMFIMRKHLFEEYSEWLFEVLAVYERIMSSAFGTVPARSCGYAGEHLLNVWGNHVIQSRGIKAADFQTVFINCTNPNPRLPDKAKAVGKQLFGYVCPYGSMRRDWIKWNTVMRR